MAAPNSYGRCGGTAATSKWADRFPTRRRRKPRLDLGYRELANTLLLPRVGNAISETRDAMGFRALDDMDAIFAGHVPRDRVA